MIVPDTDPHPGLKHDWKPVGTVATNDPSLKPTIKYVCMRCGACSYGKAGER